MMRVSFLMMSMVMALICHPLISLGATLSDDETPHVDRWVAECDRRAGDPEDPARVGAGVSRSAMDIPSAMEVCRKAVQQAPDNARVRYQYARVLFYLDENEAAMREMQRSADLEHIQAQYLLGTYIFSSQSFAPKNVCLAERYWRAAVAGGKQAARAHYLRGALQDRFFGCEGALDDEALEAVYQTAIAETKDFYERLVFEDIRAGLDKRLPAAARDLWQRCASSMSIPATQAVRVRRFGDTVEMTAALNGLILSGEKTITATTPWLTAVDLSRRGFLGAFWVLVDGEGVPQAVLRTTEIKQTQFDQVTEADSQFEGKPVRPIEVWRQVHRDFFNRMLQPLGKSWSADMPVTLERFEVFCRANIS